MNAVERAGEMMHIPMGQLPYCAVMYAKYLSKKYGFCGEVLMTAYAGYAQKLEKLECNDSLYTLNESEWEDFIKDLK